MKSILLVDDENSALKIYSLRLKALGYDVVTVNPSEQPCAYPDRKFDVLIMDGLEWRCFEEMKKIKAGRKIIWSVNTAIVFSARGNGIEAHDKTRTSLREILE